MNVPDGYESTFEPDGGGGTNHDTRPNRAVAVPYSQIRRERVEWLVKDRIPTRTVVMLAGEPGLGKSLYATGLAATLSRGGVASILLSAEDSESATIRPRLDACEAAIELVHTIRLLDGDGDESQGLSLPADINELDRLIAETGAQLVVVDPIVAYLDGGIDSHRDASVRQALAPLARIAQARGCAVLAVLHVNKGMGSDWYRRLSGSGGFGGAARSVLLFGLDPDDPDGERGRGRLLAHAKCNVAELAPSERWAVTPTVLPADGSEPEVRTARLELVGESDHGYRALLEVASDEERLPRDEAREFLLAELAGGEVATKDLQRLARDAGLAWRTVQRAARELGIKTRPSAFGKHWVWSLSQSAPQPVANSVGHPEWRTSRKSHEQRDSGTSADPESHSVGQPLEVANTGETGEGRNGTADATLTPEQEAVYAQLALKHNEDER